MFDLSSAQNSVLFSQINEPNDDSFYLKFRKDYEKEDFSLLKDSIELLSDKFNTIRNGKGIAYTIPIKSMIGVYIYQYLANHRDYVNKEAK